MRWPRHYLCAYCTGYGRDEIPRATVRLFAGVAKHGGGAMAGGFPACDLHMPQACGAALASLTYAAVPNGWEVSCYRVEPDEYDFPKMSDSALWIATRPT